MCRIIAIMNQKDGVGKTTTTVHLAHALALAGNKVAVLDMDPQNHVAINLGLNDHSDGLNHVLLAGEKLDDYVIQIRENLNVVCAGNNLADFEYVTSGGPARGYALKRALEISTLINSDFVLIDCPSTLGLLGLNAMFVADEIIIPVSGDYASLQGLSQMVAILKRVEIMLGRTLRLWIVLTRIDLENSLTDEIRLRVLKSFPSRVLKTVIRENTLFSEYADKGTDGEDYQSLAEDLLGGITS